MKLSYRGLTYIPNPTYSAVNHTVILRYRGRSYAQAPQKAQREIAQAPVQLSYRGVSYYLGTSDRPTRLKGPSTLKPAIAPLPDFLRPEMESPK